MSMSVAVPLKTVKEEKGKKEDGERRERRRERGGERPEDGAARQRWAG